MIDDIPEAVRKKAKNPPKSSPPIALLATVVLGIAAISTGIFVFLNSTKNSPQAVTENTITEASSGIQAISDPETIESPSVETNPKIETIENILGHLPYEQVDPSELVSVTADGSIKLHKSAATEFIKMQSAARQQGIILTALSGFRDEATQKYLFFEIKKNRLQDASTRAEVSAPPGYSEHHTGYAIDIGDGKAPGTNFNKEFGDTAAFRWLEKNAPRYSFELSFPEDNIQGISYEPWHWRYVGDLDSLETFHKSRNLN